MNTEVVPRRGSNAAALTLLFVLLSIVMAFPHVGRLTSHSVGDYADGTFNQWVLRWSMHALADGKDELFQANIYWPNDDTLAFSDPLLAAAPIHSILTGVFGYPLGFNLLYLLTWVAALGSAYLLANWFTRNRAASILAAITFAFAAPRLGHYGHFQLNFSFLIPLAVYFLLRFIESARLRHAVLLGLCVGAISVTTLYYAVVTGVTVIVLAVGGLFLVRQAKFQYLVGIALAAALSAATMAPIGLKYLQVHEDPAFRRTAQDAFAAHPADFLSPARGSYLYRGLDKWSVQRGANAENLLFPGFLALLLAAAGLALTLTSRRSVRSQAEALKRRSLSPLVGAAALLLILSFGHRLQLGSSSLNLPYGFFEEQVPGFNGIRATSRFVIVPLLVASVFVGLGFAGLSRRLNRRATTVVATLLGALMLLEYAAPIGSVDAIDEPAFTSLNHELARLPAGSVAELPMGDPREPDWPYIEAPRMFLSSLDWHPRINGYSGFSPDGYLETAVSLNSLAIGGETAVDGTRMLDKIGVRYLVLRTASIRSSGRYDTSEVERVLSSLPPDRIAFVRRLNGAVLIGLKQ